MDTVNYEIIKQINKDMLSTQAKQDQVTRQNEKIIKMMQSSAKNINLRYSIKYIIISAIVAFIIGASSVGGYAYYVYNHSALDLFLRKNHIKYKYGYIKKPFTPYLVLTSSKIIESQSKHNLYVAFE